MSTFEYGGERYEYDRKAAKSYRVVKAVVFAERDPAGMFDAADAVFVGRSDEYVERAGGTMEAFAGLLSAAIEAADVKN